MPLRASALAAAGSETAWSGSRGVRARCARPLGPGRAPRFARLGRSGRSSARASGRTTEVVPEMYC